MLISNNIRKLMQVYGAELDRFDTRVLALMTEMIPGLSEELLEDWERVLGIVPETGATLETRQAAAQAKFVASYSEGLPKQFYIDYAALFSVTITVDTRVAGEDPAICNVSRCGASRSIQTNVFCAVHFYFPSGEPQNAYIQSKFDQLKPAHALFIYEEV